MIAIPTARAHNTPAVLYTKLLGVRYSSMCQLPVHVCVCVSRGEKFHNNYNYTSLHYRLVKE